eukprot:CAMPEP_0176451944 /NCGR_PEP_ID=MMETSP0127-20121128/28192_1 /TAXON_ID=938130 /ORGANISM="Platyophrya macrostoma, Strain WH" /LENGTH=490 /DNA_ID=CAMNT_0017840205 /DNA_START=87 /DNA_END=1559 /DNA_ORIENTATION=-
MTAPKNIRNVVVEYLPNESFSLALNCGEIATADNTTKLLHKVIEKLNSMNSTKPLPINISSIVSLETKNKDLKTDYLLSLPNKSLDFVVEGMTLVPYFAKATSTSESSTSTQTSLEDYEFLATVGKGGFATVFLARMKQTGKFFAIKQIKKKKLSPRDERNLLQERNSMIEVNSPFVAHLYTAFQTKEYCYLVMEYMPGGDLLSYSEKGQRMNEEAAKFYVAEIALGLNSLHEKKLIYRDLKPENILTDLEGHAVLSDFGLSKKQKKDELNYSICGTPHFIAPEVYKKVGYTHVADYFSLGILSFELVTGRLPFEASNVKELAKKIVGDAARFPSTHSAEFHDFVNRLLEKNPAKRLGAQDGINEIFSHPWLKTIDMNAISSKKLKAPKVNKQAKTLEKLPSEFSPERPNFSVLEGLNLDAKIDESQRIAMFSYYSNDSSKKTACSEEFPHWDEDMSEIEELVSVNGKASKKVADYVFGHKLEAHRKIFA